MSKSALLSLIRITEVPAFSLPMTIVQDQALKTEMESIEIEAPKSFCPKDFRSVWKNCWNEVERIFVETQKDFFE